MNERQAPARETTRAATDDADTNEQQAPARETTRATTGNVDTTDVQKTGAQVEDTGFLPDDRMDGLRDRWDDIQTEFVDDPKAAVHDAHKLVTELVDELTDTFARERSTLEGQWSGGGDADTEALRIALQRYRSFFNRLLAS